MIFDGDLKDFSLKCQTRSNDVFVGVVQETTRSIVEGSEITAAPGQPVDTGALKASWQTTYSSPTQAMIATNIEYAPYIEAGLNSRAVFTLRSAVGGFHSRALTIAGFPRIVEVVTARVVK